MSTGSTNSINGLALFQQHGRDSRDINARQLPLDLTFSHNFNRVPTRPVARPKKNVGLSRQLFGMHSSSSFSTSISRHLTRYTKIVANSQAVAHAHQLKGSAKG